MAHFSFFRFVSSLSFGIKDSFCEHKKWYIVFGILIGLGFVLGLIAGIKIAPDASISKIPDSVLSNFLKGDTSLIGVFFARIFNCLCLFALILLTNFKPFTCVLTFIIIIYKSFCLGTVCAFLIAIYKVGGFINVLFLIFPTQLLLICAMSLFAVVCVDYNFMCRNYGGSIFCADFFVQCKPHIVFAVIITLISILLELILLPWLSTLLIVA